jgi:hypothetical protein
MENSLRGFSWQPLEKVRLAREGRTSRKVSGVRQADLPTWPLTSPDSRPLGCSFLFLRPPFGSNALHVVGEY